MQKPTLEELRKLSVEDRLQLLEDVWTSLDEEHDQLPMPKWHEEELARRLKDIDENGSQGMEWNEFYKGLREKLSSYA
jgi:putative addiction module component (TIGR02574 family)